MAAALAILAVAGCHSSPLAAKVDPAAIQLALAAQNEAAKLPDSPEKEPLVKHLERLNQLLGGEQTPAIGPVTSAADWQDLFGPKTLVVDSFTKFVTLEEPEAGPGLEVRVRLKDRFEDPVKALGSFRIETFTFVPRSLNKHGLQAGNWSIGVYNEKDVRKYYDSLDRSYRFPLRLTHNADSEKVIVRVTYYLPDGSGNKLFAERIIKKSGD
jgi:hypothetical protein